MPNIFYDSSKNDLPKRKKNEVYETPPGFIDKLLDHPKMQELNSHYYHMRDHLDIIDIGAGNGIWGQKFYEVFDRLGHSKTMEFTGIDIRDLDKPDCYQNWIINDFLLHDLDYHSYDMVIGNPPFLKGTKNMTSLLQKSLDICKENGVVIFLLPLTYLATTTRYENFFKHGYLRYVFVSTQRIRFYGKSSKPEEYAVYVFKKNNIHNAEIFWLDKHRA